MQEGVPGYLKYRVLDSNTGAVIIADLPHLHESSWRVFALQKGFPGSASIGDFKIPLPAPGTELFKDNEATYALLGVGQRVEAFLGDVITGSPKFSGVITKLNQPLAANWEISGSDTLWWLQQSQVFPGEQMEAFQETAGFFATEQGPRGLFTRLLGTREVVWDDDFAGWSGSPHPNSSDYTNSSWTFTSADLYNGLPALTTSVVSPTEAHVVTNTTWNLSTEYAWCAVIIQGTLLVAPDINATSEAGILLLSDANAQNCILARAVARFSNSPLGVAVDAEIWTRTSGTYTMVAQKQNVFSGLLAFSYDDTGGSPGYTFPFEVTATMWPQVLASGNPVITLAINGTDTGLNTNVTPPLSSGGIGLRCSPAPGAGGNPISATVNRLTFQYRTSQAIALIGTDRFQPGTVATGTGTINDQLAGNGQSHLDLMLLASIADGFWLRKNPGFGYKSDTIDFAASPGSDLSQSIVFEEDLNIQDAQVAPVADLFATDAKVNGIPGDNSGGNITWRARAATGNMVLTDTVTDVAIPGYALLSKYSRVVQTRKSNPMQATQVVVVRTADTADKWRELDYITVHIPTLRIYRQKSQVVGYEFTEGSLTQTLYLSQVPDFALPSAGVQRLVRPLEYVCGTYKTR